MLRRALVTAAATAALVALPAVAMAYDAPGYTTTVSDPTPAIGQAFTVTTDGNDPGQGLTLTVTSDPASVPNSAILVAGSVAVPKTADGSGNASWTVTLNAAGTYTLAVTDSGTGALVGDDVVTVAAAPADPGDALGATGFETSTVALGAAGLVLVGGTIVLLVRRRTRAAA